MGQKNPKRQFTISIPFEIYETFPAPSFTSLKQRIVAGYLSLTNGIIIIIMNATEILMLYMHF